MGGVDEGEDEVMWDGHESVASCFGGISIYVRKRRVKKRAGIEIDMADLADMPIWLIRRLWFVALGLSELRSVPYPSSEGRPNPYDKGEGIGNR